MTYKDQKKVPLVIGYPLRKKQLLLMREVTVGFDLSQVKFEVDSIHKILKIKNLPKRRN